MILIYIHNLTDENLVEKWTKNCYYQDLCGEQYYQSRIPCVPTELIAVKKQNGEAGRSILH